MIKKTFLIFFITILIPTFSLPIFDLNQANKHGASSLTAKCNKDTVIDFSFNPSSHLKCAQVGGVPPIICGIDNLQSNTLTFLDIRSTQLTYSLIRAEVAVKQIVKGFDNAFIFQFKAGTQFVYLAIPFTVNYVFSPIPTAQQKIINEEIIDLTLSQQRQLIGLKSLTDTILTNTGVSLSAFNFLNTANHGKFYQVMTTDTTKTLLVSKFRFKMPITTSFATTPFFSLTSASLNYGETADTLCWGSFSYGLFQTHMRQSVPLWFFIISVFLFWMYNLISNQITPQIYQRSFKDNKWTCWSLYSIFWLSHQQFFTKTSRTAMFLINTLWQAMIVSAIYSTVGINSADTIIIWAGVVAFVASMPIPYIIGWMFLRRIHQSQLQKFQKQIKIHGSHDKVLHQQLQKQIVHLEQHLYAIYYGFYSMIIILMIIFGIISVHVMQKLSRQNFYLHWYWLASVAIAICLDHLVFDPIFTAIFGNFKFYRMRGYYYESDLSELAKQLD